jgi:hypothetical protein
MGAKRSPHRRNDGLGTLEPRPARLDSKVVQVLSEQADDRYSPSSRYKMGKVGSEEPFGVGSRNEADGLEPRP